NATVSSAACDAGPLADRNGPCPECGASGKKVALTLSTTVTAHPILAYVGKRQRKAALMGENRRSGSVMHGDGTLSIAFFDKVRNWYSERITSPRQAKSFTR